MTDDNEKRNKAKLPKIILMELDFNRFIKVAYVKVESHVYKLEAAEIRVTTMEISLDIIAGINLEWDIDSNRWMVWKLWR